MGGASDGGPSGGRAFASPSRALASSSRALTPPTRAAKAAARQALGEAGVWRVATAASPRWWPWQWRMLRFFLGLPGTTAARVVAWVVWWVRWGGRGGALLVALALSGLYAFRARRRRRRWGVEEAPREALLRRQLQVHLDAAKTYPEWLEFAARLDALDEDLLVRRIERVKAVHAEIADASARTSRDGAAAAPARLPGDPGEDPREEFGLLSYGIQTITEDVEGQNRRGSAEGLEGGVPPEGGVAPGRRGLSGPPGAATPSPMGGGRLTSTSDLFRMQHGLGVSLDRVPDPASAEGPTTTSAEVKHKIESLIGYEYELIKSKTLELRHLLRTGDLRRTIFTIRSDLLRNLGGVTEATIFRNRRASPPRMIQAYVEEVQQTLRWLSVAEGDDDFRFTLNEKLQFFGEARHSFGRTALMLSGGASLGLFHLGVVKALHDQKLLPRIITGSSAGAVVGSVVCSTPDSELAEALEKAETYDLRFFFKAKGKVMDSRPHAWLWHNLRDLLRDGALYDIGVLKETLQALIGELTFQEAFDRTGRIFCVTVTSPREREPPRLLNYLTSPHVLIWSAVCASCAMPGLFKPVSIVAKDWKGETVPYAGSFDASSPNAASKDGGMAFRDGSLGQDLPAQQLAELFNVNHFIASQVNPHVVQSIRLSEWLSREGGTPGLRVLVSLMSMEFKHRIHQAVETGLLPYWIAKILPLFAQRTIGDVTIASNVTLRDVAQMVSNPTREFIRNAMTQGERATWKKIASIQANCGIEICLDTCAKELKAKTLRNSASMERVLSQGRIPSWTTRDFNQYRGGASPRGGEYPFEAFRPEASATRSGSNSNFSQPLGMTSQGSAASLLSTEMDSIISDEAIPGHLSSDDEFDDGFGIDVGSGAVGGVEELARRRGTGAADAA